MSLPTADYRYHALSATDSIRLLTLSRDESQPHGMLLSLAEAHLSDRPEFVALSYTWRLPEYADARDRSDPGEEGRTFEVACDGRLMRISENLFSFLGSALAVRGAGAKKKTTATTVSSSSSSSSSTGLTSLTAELLNGLPMWIDAFCVDQGNNSERQHQVLLMHRIYSSARNVVIWMGPSEPEADFLWIHDRFIPRLARLTREKPEFVAQHLKKDPLCLSAEVALEIGLDTCSRWTTAWPLLVRFFRRRRWFDRGWVVQEVTMADPARALVLCGTTALSWRRLAALSQFLHQSNWGVLLTRHLVYPLVAAARSGFPLSSTLDFSISAEVLLGARANTQERLLDIGDKIRQISLIRPVLTNTAGRTSVVDSAGKWHRDAETAWFMCASLLVNLLRSSQLGDNRDHLYGCLGRMSTLLPLNVSSPILPDYGKSVQEVYISSAALILQRTPLLFQLSLVESETERNYKELPSWVPDYSTPAVRHPSWDKGQGITIDANTNFEVLYSIQRSIWSGSLRKPQCRGSSLFLYGTQLATVVNTDTSSATQGRAMWNLVQGTYVKLLENSQKSFWHAVAAALLYERLESCARGDGLANDLESMRQLAKWFLPRILPTRINQDIWRDLRHRCLYATDDHRLGLGPAAMALGDAADVARNEVWLLEGARTPFILRRTSEGAPRGTGEDVDDCVTFRIVGETHLHQFDIRSSSLTLPEKRHLFQKIRLI